MRSEVHSAAAGSHERVTIVVTTSPVPSHPSPALLRTLFASFRAHLPSLEGALRILVCDGYRRASSGTPALCPEHAYQAFLGQVDQLAALGEFGPCQVIKLENCHGYGLALGRALEAVRTEFVLIVQHDWLFVRDVEIGAIVTVLDSQPDVKYIGMQSLTTLDYARRVRLRYGLVLPAPRMVAGLVLVPQLLWYDKPHLCRAMHYRDIVLRDAPMGVGECPERRYGLELMWPQLQAAGDRLEEEHRQFGTFFWDVGAEVVYHLSGRKLYGDPQGEANVGAAPMVWQAETELRGEAVATFTYTAAAVERKAHVPGLALPTASRTQAPRFKGRCFMCGVKGHSKLHCPERGTVELHPSSSHLIVGC